MVAPGTALKQNPHTCEQIPLKPALEDDEMITPALEEDETKTPALGGDGT